MLSMKPVTTELLLKPVDFFRTDPNQPRKEFSESDLLSLGASMRSLGQLQPVGAKPDGTLLWGERRYRAAKLAGIAELSVIIAERPLSDTEVRLIQLAENVHRTDLSAYEKYIACSELMCGNPTWQLKDLAEHVHLDPSMVTRLLSPSRCIPAWQEALKAGKVGISDCYAASKLPQDQQAGLLALKLSGASRDAIEQAARRTRSTPTPSVKLSSVKCPLSTGTVVSVRGPEMDLDGLIEALASALEAARKANKEGLDVKTLSRVMGDRAKAGAP